MKCFALWLLSVISTAVAADDARVMSGATRPLSQHVLAHRNGRSAWSFNFSALEGDRSPLPIGVFDSGIGGLTVLEAILKLDVFDNATLQPGSDGVPDFAGEKFIYFGDQANMPYGNYPSQGREDFLRELILKDVTFLLGTRWRESAAAAPRFDKPPVKAIVIACNTATAYGLEGIRAALNEWGLDVPVIGIIEAGARAVVELLPADGKPVTVGVLATVGTCSCNAYPKAIEHAAGIGGKPIPQIVQQGSVGLAGAIEGNPAFVWTNAGPRPVTYQGLEKSGAPLNSVAGYAAHDVSEMLVAKRKLPDVSPLKFLVLGCTHFPLAEKEISHAFEVEGVTGVSFVNPAEHTAKELFRELARRRLRVPSAKQSRDLPRASFYFSVPNAASPDVRLAADGSLDATYKSSRTAGHLEIEDTVVVPLNGESLPASSRQLVRSLPSVWQRLAGKAGAP